MSIVENVLGPGFGRFLARLEVAKRRSEGVSRSAYVGVTGAQGSDLVIIAAANEYGTKTKDGKTHIPSRPFLRNAMNDPKLAEFVGRQAALFYQDKLKLDDVLNRIGAYGTALVQRSIGSNIAPENAQSTIARKGSSRTLINTGRLRQSIAWVVK